MLFALSLDAWIRTVVPVDILGPACCNVFSGRVSVARTGEPPREHPAMSRA
jgi:hypothetical protein